MRHLLIFALIAFFACAGFAQISPELRQKMDQVSASTYIPVMIALNERISVEEIAATHGLRGDDGQIVEIMKNKATASQHWLSSYCSRSEVVDFKSFWIANMVSLKATSKVLEQLAQQPEVNLIFLDEEQQFISYFPGTESRDAWGLKKIGSDFVNNELGYKGEGIIVAVIDTGVNYNHTDLKGRVISGKDTINNDMDPLDDNGHGSHCAGTVAGTQYGVAPHATILAVKVLSGAGSGSWESVAGGIQYVADYNESVQKVHVASMSLGGGGAIQAVLREALMNAVNMGIHFAIAAGNSGPGASSIGTPGDQKEIESIGATDSSDYIASFSSRGPVTRYGTSYIKPDVSAPGVNITSCWKDGTESTKTISGTSMATPHVAGLMALMLNKNPKLTFTELRAILENTALDLGTAGQDNVYGYGRVQGVEAVNNVPAPATK